MYIYMHTQRINVCVYICSINEEPEISEDGNVNIIAEVCTDMAISYIRGYVYICSFVCLCCIASYGLYLRFYNYYTYICNLIFSVLMI